MPRAYESNLTGKLRRIRGSVTQKRFGVSVIGGSGYGAGELLRFLSNHPDIEVVEVISRSHAGKPVSSVHSNLASVLSLNFQGRPSLTWCRDYQRGAFVCSMPSGQAAATISQLQEVGLPDNADIVDLSGDFRLGEKSTHEAFYPEAPFAADLRQGFLYGLPELNRTALAGARWVTNPGCLATAAILALAPFRGEQLIGPVVIDAKTGTSGAGRDPQPSMHHPSRAADFTAYKPLHHRHEPEILQALGADFSTRNSIMFIPHLLPIPRGIFVTVYMTCGSTMLAEEGHRLCATFYEKDPFIRVRSTPPRLVDVIGTNFCDIHVTSRGSSLVVMAALDNLGKGMAGQCVQNLHLMWGLSSTRHLMTPALGPV